MNAMVTAYLVCALWSSVTEKDTPFDQDHDVDDFDEATVKEATEECEKFKRDAVHLIEEWSDEELGHDLWLTRNGHGAGFWCRGRSNGEELTKMAKDLGEAYCWERDDGKVGIE